MMMEKERTYKENLNELETIVAKMQSEECDIDSLAAMTARALELLKQCKEKLTKTDAEVKRCLEELGNLQ